MKDPLQTEETPYDILNLEPGASREEINQAFAKGLGKRNIQELTRAKKNLQDPEERFMLDFLYYNTQVLSRLDPNPLKDKACLSPENRTATAASWEKLFKTNFSDMGIVHILSVLWYWGTIYEEDRNSESVKVSKAQHDDSSSIPQVEQMWQKVIAYWVTMIGDLKSLNEGQALQGDLENKLRTKFEKTLSKHFHDRRECYRDNGNESLVQLYQKLDLDLKTELYTAKEVTRIGVRTGQGKISFGRLMLDQVGLLDLIRKTVHSQLQQSPERKDLRKLRDALSNYSSIAVLISNDKPEDALAIIHNLPGNEKRTNEVRELKVRALMKRGRQQASLDNTKDALDAWGEALRISKDEVIKGKIISEIVSTCQKRSAALRQHQPDEAIEILESGLALVGEKDLQLTLCDLLTKRGIERVNKAQERANKQTTKLPRKILTTMNEGVADLKRATDLGSEHAAKQLKEAEKLIIVVKLNPLIRRAEKAAEKSDWDTAISCLEQALSKAGPNPPHALEENLAIFLTNRGIKTVENAKESPELEGNLIIAKIEMGIADFERAVGMGYKKAEEHIEIAKKIIIDIEKIPSSVREANKAAERGDWDTAINYLEQALNEAGQDLRDVIKKNLATLYFNRAVETINRFVKGRSGAVKDRERAVLEFIFGRENIKNLSDSKIAEFVKAMDGKDLSRDAHACLHCQKSTSSSYGESWYSMRFPIGSEGVTLLLCSGCSQEARSVLDGSSGPSSEDRSLLDSAHGDLLRAKELERSNARVKKTLEDLKDIYLKLGLSPPNIKSPQKTRKKEGKEGFRPSEANRNFIYAAFLMLILIGVAFVGLHRVYPIMDSLVRDRLPTELMGLIPLAFIVIAIILFKYFWQKICRRRWKQKNLFQRFVEVALYCSFLSICFVVLQSEIGIKELYVSDWSKIGFLKRGYLANKSHEPVKNSGIADSKITETNYSTKVTKKRTEVAYNARPAEAVSNINSEHIKGGTLTEITDKLTQKKPQAKPEKSKTNKILPVSKQRSGPTHYRVRTGDTLSHICSRHGLTLNELCRLNGIAADAVIYPGQRLIVRAAKK